MIIVKSNAATHKTMLTRVQINDRFIIVRCNNFHKSPPPTRTTEETMTVKKSGNKPLKKAAAAPLETEQTVIRAAATAAPAETQTLMEKTMMKNNKQYDKLTQNAAILGQDHMDAMMKSSTILAKGMEDIIKTCMEIAQNAGEKSANATKTLMSCKTLNELTEAQTKLAQSSFDDFMSNATRLSEMSVKLATECFSPINDQMGRSMKKANDTMAA